MSAVLDMVVDTNKIAEEVAGQTEEKNMAGARHSGVGTRLIIKLGRYLEENEIGAVYGADATFKLGVRDRLPDVSFISAARIPPDGEPVGSWEIAPDLAVEVISPNDVYDQVVGKVAEYFAAGVKQVWLISPEYKSVTVYHSPAQSIILFEDEELAGEDLLPGFRCAVRDLFKQPKHA
ncbi:MAG: Uma2 family endonuclease [Blastocatellia bacterium]